MDEIKVKKLKQIFSALSNEYRLKIIEVCSNKKPTITQLSKLLNLNYTITVEYTSMLERDNLVKKIRNDDKTVSVESLIIIKDNGEIKRI